MILPLVSVCIVSWNSAADLPICLAAVRAQSYPNLEVIVVDNASGDGSAALAAAHYPSASVIANTANLGFCGGHNQGIAAAQGAYYLPLNADVTMQPDYVAAMVDALEAVPRLGMAAARLYQLSADAVRRFDSTGLFIDRTRRQYLRGFAQADRGQFDQAGEVFGVDGAAPLYRRAMLEDARIDGQVFDEAFFAHKEDVDLAWRARILGWGCAYVPDAVAEHRRNFQPGRRSQMADEIKLHAVKNRYLLLLKNEALDTFRRDALPIIWYDLKIFAYLTVFERASLRALPALAHLRSRALHWRHQIWSRARVTPQETRTWFVNPAVEKVSHAE